MNRVKLYGNGIAQIVRRYELSGQTTAVSIPVRKDDLPSVVASISVFGDGVTVVKPVSYSPTNARNTKLTISSSNVLREFATKFQGAELELTIPNAQPARGRCAGVQTFELVTDGVSTEKFRVILVTDGGIRSFDSDYIQNYRFTDPAVRAEIEKALVQASQSIKPDSSFVEFAVSGPGEAQVVYTTPAAAWKMRYRLGTDEKGAAVLTGHAVVDNDSDDDWNDVIVSCVSGEPITFDTDLAEIRRPARSKVNAVADNATRAVAARKSLRTFAALENYGGVRVQACADFAGEAAGEPEADIREAGIFFSFTSGAPVTIPAKKSSVIFMFRSEIGDSTPYLHYRESADIRHPYRAVRFKNSTGHALPRGVCQVNRDGDFQGEMILETCQVGETARGLYAREAGVTITKKVLPHQPTLAMINIANGVGFYEESVTATAEYRVENNLNQPFELEIDHSRNWAGSKLSAAGGNFNDQDVLSCQVGGGGHTVTVTEIGRQRRNFTVNAGWLASFVATKHPLTESQDLKNILARHAAWTRAKEKLAEAEEEVVRLQKDQSRLLPLIKEASAEQAETWRRDLARFEETLRLTQNSIPNLRREASAAQVALDAGLAALATGWEI